MSFHILRQGWLPLAIIVLVATACGAPESVPQTVPPESTTAPTATQAVPAEPTTAPTATHTVPVATVQAEATPPPGPTPTSPTAQEGSIRGVLVDRVTQQGIPAIDLCLIPNNPETGEFGVPLMPPVTTDAQGAFLFQDIPPGHYSLFSMTWGAPWDDQLGNMFVFEAQAGQTTDLGAIEVDH